MYATPDSNQSQSPQTSAAVASPYSSVPVPVNHGTFGRNKRPGFATISRFPSVPNGALIRSLEADDNIINIFSGNLEKGSTLPNPKRTSTFLAQQDLQSFLINSPDKVECDNVIENNTNIDRESFEPVPTVSSFVPMTSVPKIPNSVEMNESIVIKNSPQSPVRIRTNHQLTAGSSNKPAVPKKPATLNRHSDIFEGVKKNIITNPKALKKSHSMASKPLKTVASAPNIGYLANGGYIDPNPMPERQPEIYAPGSSYSDRSNVMSTFLGDLPLSQPGSSAGSFRDE